MPMNSARVRPTRAGLFPQRGCSREKGLRKSNDALAHDTRGRCVYAFFSSHVRIVTSVLSQVSSGVSSCTVMSSALVHAPPAPPGPADLGRPNAVVSETSADSCESLQPERSTTCTSSTTFRGVVRVKPMGSPTGVSSFIMILLLVRLTAPGRGGFREGLDDITRGGGGVRDARSTSGDR